MRAGLNLILILLLLLAPTVCQAHQHEPALSTTSGAAGHGKHAPFGRPHFHAHHLWFLNWIDDHEDDADSEYPDGDAESLAGQQVAAVFGGQALSAPVAADAIHAFSGDLDLIERLATPLPSAKWHPPPKPGCPAAKRPIYLTTLALLI